MSLALLALLGCPKPSDALDPALSDTPELPTAGSDDPLGVLEHLAGSEDPSSRARALSLLLTEGDAAKWGPIAMRDESDWVRRAAIEALAARNTPEGRALLEALAADPAADPYLRGLAAMRAPGEASATAIRSALAAEREAWRVAPLALAAVRLGDTEARETLDRALRSGQLPLEIEFFQEIGRTGDTALLPALTAAQATAEEELVFPIAAARLMLGDASGESALRTALDEPDEELKLEVLDYLVLVDHPASVALLRRASSSGPDLVTWYADLALAERTGTDSGVFEKAFASPDRELRALAVRFAGLALDTENKRTKRQALAVVSSGLADPDPAVRAESCRAVAASGLAEARPAAERLLQDDIDMVRVEASGAVLALMP